MSAEEKAYQAALGIIARAREAKGAVVDLNSPACRALTRLPPELSDLQALTIVDLSNTRITDLAPLAALTGLQTLTLNQTMVSDLLPLTGLTALQSLGLGSTKVSDLRPLAGLTRLERLDLDRTGVNDVSALAGLTGLRTLDIRHTGVSDLSSLAELTVLQTLVLNQTGVNDLRPLTGLARLQNLWLDRTKVSDISPLSALTRLRTLTLDQTRINDLSPLTELTGLQGLWIARTEVMDLRPICGAAGLVKGRSGLSFRDTPATLADSELLRLSRVKDHEQRTRETLAYLNSLPPWPEPYTPKARPDGKPPQPIGRVPEPPEQDPALPLIWGEKGFTFLAQSIDADPVTEAALEDLRALLEDLRRKGNRHDDLYRLAGEMLDRASGEIADLNMVKLHLSYQKLRRLYQSRDERAEKFDDETVSVLGSVLEIVPGVTLADANVRVLIERQEADRATPSAPEIVEAENAVLAAIQEDNAPFAPDVKDAAKTILEPGHDDRLAATRSVLSRNSLVAVLRFLRYDPIGAGISVWAVTQYGPTLLNLAQTMGADTFIWAQMVLGSVKAEYQVAVGIVKETLGSGRIGKKPKN